MTTLLTFRDNLKAWYSRYDHILTPIVKCILAFVVFYSVNKQFGYMDILNNNLIVLLLAVICAFLPLEVIAGIGGVLLVLHSLKVSMEVGLLSVGLILVFYCAFMRFSPKTGVIVFLVPICYSLKLIYVLPIILGFVVGPAAIIPVVFGFLLYNYEAQVSELVKVLAATTEEDEAVQQFQYIANGLISNKEMLLMMIAAAFVILITYSIYRLSFEHAWIIAFVVGAFCNVALFLAGNVLLMVDVDIVSVIIGSVIGIICALLIQFFKGIVDYQRTEILQFEDDDYYYYVKAVPKLSISGANKNVKHINEKTKD